MEVSTVLARSLEALRPIFTPGYCCAICGSNWRLTAKRKVPNSNRRPRRRLPTRRRWNGSSHDNSRKNHERQSDVLGDVGAQIRSGSSDVFGVMIESNLVGGRQEPRNKADLVYGQSITDACVDFSTTERMLERLAVDSATQRLSASSSPTTAG